MNIYDTTSLFKRKVIEEICNYVTDTTTQKLLISQLDEVEKTVIATYKASKSEKE